MPPITDCPTGQSTRHPIVPGRSTVSSVAVIASAPVAIRNNDVEHDYRQDTAFEGRRLVRLPDRSLCYADEYEERLKEYERNQGSD